MDGSFDRIQGLFDSCDAHLQYFDYTHYITFLLNLFTTHIVTKCGYTQLCLLILLFSILLMFSPRLDTIFTTLLFLLLHTGVSMDSAYLQFPDVYPPFRHIYYYTLVFTTTHRCSHSFCSLQFPWILATLFTTLLFLLLHTGVLIHSAHLHFPDV